MANSGGTSSSSSPGVVSMGVAASVSVAVHPLVIMNVSDHFTRTRAQSGKDAVGPIIGALIGRQEGRNIEVFNSFELEFMTVKGFVIVNVEYFESKAEQFKQVFQNLDVLGWYTTGTEAPTQREIKIHEQLCKFNESPIMLKLNPHATASELPVSVFESILDLVNGQPNMQFVEVPYTLATEEAERIGVDHVARLQTAGTGVESSVVGQLSAQYSAIKMLHSRVRLILEYVKSVRDGKLPANHEILREACSLCNQLPVLDTPQFQQDFNDQCNDVMLMAYLAAITKGCAALNEYITKFNTIHDRGMGRRFRGLLF